VASISRGDFGYENIYVIDDSDDDDVLNYYESISKIFPIKFYFNNPDLNNIHNKFNEIMHSIKDECDFMIKMDTDEFFGVYDEKTNEISIDKEVIRRSFNNLVINGYKYKCSYTMNSLPLDSRDNPLEYVHFTQPFKTTFKTFFYSKTFWSCDLGCHIGCLIPPYEDENIFNETNIAIIHYHNQSFYRHMDNCKKVLISHNYINVNDDKETQTHKLTVLPGCPSGHKVIMYLKYLTDPLYPVNYYKSFIEQPDKYKFEKLKNLFINDKCIIITTINNPTHQILYYANLIGWDLIIVGDKKTNDELYKKINCVYLGLEQQKDQFPSIYDKIPLNSYARKMFGYLYAIKNKYKVVYDTDDDNKYIENLNNFNANFKQLNGVNMASTENIEINIKGYNETTICNLKNCLPFDVSHFSFNRLSNILYLKHTTDVNDIARETNNDFISGIFKEDKLSSTRGFVNLYKIYTDSNIWPRGIPPGHISGKIVPELTDNKTDMNVAIIQGLVNNDPDVDAYYRININNESFCFNKNQNYNVILDKYSVCPFNTQNTFWIDSSTFYAMYLPVSVTFRYTDILRGFIALYQLWKHNKTIKFTFPSAEQIRNAHDLNKDYESELTMYKTAGLVIELLNNNKNASIQEIYKILEKNNIVDKTEIDVLNEWLNLINEFTNLEF